MSHVSSKEIDEMSQEQRELTLEELRDEMLQLRSQQALGGSASNSGAYKQTRRSIARLLTSKAPYPQEFVGTNDTFGESGSPIDLIA